MKVKNFKELENLIKAEVEKGLKSDVSKKANRIMMKHIDKDVYDAYEPTVYARRYDGSEQGLSDTGLHGENNISDIVFQVNHGTQLWVINETKGSKYYTQAVEVGGKTEYKLYKSRNYGKPIAPVIETGEGYDIGLNADEQARPFIKNTADELRRNKIASNVLKSYLKKRGFKVK